MQNDFDRGYFDLFGWRTRSTPTGLHESTVETYKCVGIIFARLICSNNGTANALVESAALLLIEIMRVAENVVLGFLLMAHLAPRINSGNKPNFAHFLVGVASQWPHQHDGFSPP